MMETKTSYSESTRPEETAGESARAKGAEKKQKKSAYLILGCGSFGFALAKRLKDEGYEVVIVDIEKNKVETLTDEGFVSFCEDIGIFDVAQLKKEYDFDTVFILSKDLEANKKALLNIKKELPEAKIIIRASSIREKEEFEKIGADLIFFPQEDFANLIMEHLRKKDIEKTAKKLLDVIKSLDVSKKFGIVVHDNPDPDAIASALALKYIAKREGISSDILYGGIIGHQVNRAFVNLLGIEMKRIEENVLDEYEKFALIDTNVPGSNNSLPKSRARDVVIVIDHHEVGEERISAEFCDINPELGATSTILTRYLRELDIPLDKVLATALFHGIRSDTNNFRRKTHPEDFFASAFLCTMADNEFLDQIETPPMSAETFDIIGRAILNRRVRSSNLISNIGTIVNRDALPQAADYLLNLEGITTVIVIGMNEENIYVCGRTRDVRVNIGEVFTQAFGKIGSAGGHSKTAAAQIPLGIFSGVREKDMLSRLVDDAITKRFLAAMHVEDNELK